MRTILLVRSFLFACGVFMATPVMLQAQCPTSWTIKDDCGPILANGGIAPNSPAIFCEGQIVTFLNTTNPNAGVTNVYMDWGDGTCETYVGNPPSFTHAYDVPDDSCISVPSSTYLLYMGVEKKCAGGKTSFHYIITPLAVMFKPVADPVPPQVICQNEQAIFLNQCNTPSNTTTTWTTSDGTTMNGETFLHAFTTPGTQTVTLTVSNMCGSDSETMPVTVLPTAVAAATVSDTSLCLPDAVVTVTNQSQNTLGQIWSVIPDVGFVYLNGTGPGSANPEIKFIDPGTYALKMLAIGCGTPSWTQLIKVSAAPSIILDTIPNSCTNLTLDPNNYFTPVGGLATSSIWHFSGALPASVNGPNPPPILFYGVGMHIVSLDLSNYCGTANLSDTFNILPPAVAAVILSDTVLCIPNAQLSVTNNSSNAQGFSWWVTPGNWGNFANGTDANSSNPVFNFTSEGFYTVHLKVTGCTSPEWSGVVHVRRRPNATLVQSIEDGCFSVTLNPANYITFGGGQPDYINWIFTGGQPGTASGSMPPIVVFPDTGYHVVQAMIGNVCGIDTVQEGFTIFNPTVVTATAPSDSMCRSAGAIQLQAIPSGGFWSGPGVSNNGIFDPAAGLNNAWNQLVYNYGPPDCRIYDTVQIFVMSINVDAGPPLVRCVNAGTITLSNQMPDNGFWLGPGVSSGGVFDPAIAGAGQHQLFYTVIDANGCPNPDALLVNVTGAPQTNLAAINDGCVGAPIDLGALASSSANTTCEWDFGDGTTSTSCYPYHTYDTQGNFEVRLIVTNGVGCRDTAANPVAIHDLPNAEFANDQTQGCADLLVDITNNSVSSGITNYSWAYGDGGTDTLFQPGVHTYLQGQNDTIYLLELTATNHCGQTIVSKEITVFPKPQVHFATDIDDGCTPVIVHFNNLSVGSPHSYRWYVNDVLVDTSAQLGAQIFYTGSADSLYHVVLIAENDCGIDTLQHDVVVHPNLVQAFAHIDTTMGCAPFTVHAFNNSTYGIYASWTFDDGGGAVGDSVQHTFLHAGQYYIHLFVNNGCGYDSVSVPVQVLGQPDLSFLTPAYVCYGDTLSFLNTSLGIAGSCWFFGDGTMNLLDESPYHMYPAPGQYNVTMIGFSATTGCPDTISQTVLVRDVPAAAAAISVTSGCEPLTIAPVNLCSGGDYYLWNYGDGTTSTAAASPHTYVGDGQYQVNLKVTDGYGCSDDTTIFPITVYPEPDLSFNLKQGPLCTTPITLTFLNTTTNADAYEWTFDNGINSTAIDPVFNISSGPLGVHLAGHNMFGCSAVLDTQVTIYSAPMVDVHLDQASGCAPFTVLFEQYSQAVNHFQWSFGDGQGSNDDNPIYRFDTPGTYKVRVVADHDGICYDSSDILIKVLPLPLAAFTCAALDTTVAYTGIFLFHDASTDAVDWDWDFGDGGTSTVQNPAHRYYINGDKTVTLIVKNAYECSDTIRELIKPEPFGNLFIPNTFSPEVGADGAREFRPVGVGLRQFKIEVFSTNGQRVWVSTTLENGQPTEAWDGTFMGKLCPPGVYWWQCSAILATSQPWGGMSFDGQEAPIREGKLLLVR